MDTLPPPAPEPILPQPAVSRKLFWLVGGLGILALGIAIGLFSAKFLNQSQRPSPLTSTPTAPSSPQSPTPFPTLDPTADWKTYTSTEAGISFKYPDSPFIYPQNPQGGLSVYLTNKINVDSPLTLGVDGIMLDFITYPSLNSDQIQRIKSAIGSANDIQIDGPLQKGTVIKIKNLTIPNSQGALFTHSPSLDQDNNDSIYYNQAIWIKGNKVYSIRLISLSEETFNNFKSLFNQILSTFHFLK